MKRDLSKTFRVIQRVLVRRSESDTDLGVGFTGIGRVQSYDPVVEAPVCKGVSANGADAQCGRVEHRKRGGSRRHLGVQQLGRRLRPRHGRPHGRQSKRKENCSEVPPCRNSRNERSPLRWTGLRRRPPHRDERWSRIAGTCGTVHPAARRSARPSRPLGAARRASRAASSRRPIMVTPPGARPVSSPACTR